jgi:hypothetical protein
MGSKSVRQLIQTVSAALKLRLNTHFGNSYVLEEIYLFRCSIRVEYMISVLSEGDRLIQ